jgi:protoporphyrin/coproporphyrin ferrochelatase
MYAEVSHAYMMNKKGILLINLGTPKSCETQDVRHYLQEFLMDKRVITLPTILRFILVNGIIAPFRSRNSAKNYAKIWTKEGSPLLTHSQKLSHALQASLGKQYHVVLAMRYGYPCIAAGLKELEDYDEIIILPLYPQYASATTGSSIEAVFSYFSKREYIPNLRVITDYYENPSYIEALKQSIKSHYQADHHLLLSYHGLPEKQLQQLGCKAICEGPCTGKIRACYRRQAYASSKALADAMGLTSKQYSVGFQSRLGKTPWIKPFTDELLITLREKGIDKLMIACPSFTVDCLETLEEIAIGIKELWFELGGKSFHYIPCLNQNKSFVKAR